ncbi:hypothetical protein YFHUAIHA_CDS0083 [Phage C48C1]|nr:hypothetical protein YFHUAIHA_CDS0083 [Phage C48C1]
MPAEMYQVSPNQECPVDPTLSGIFILLLTSE